MSNIPIKSNFILEWEKHYDPVPKGKIVIFLSGDVLNAGIRNLMPLDRKIHVRMNQMGFIYQDPESTRTALMWQSW